MNLKLAQELKDAGFPQTHNDGDIIFAAQVGKDLLHYPTLEELIEACAKPITIYIEDNNCDAEQAGSEICGHGSSPTEAVARLWLALNKKD